MKSQVYYMVHDRNAVEAAPQTKIEMLHEIFTSCKLYPIYTAQQSVKRLEIYGHELCKDSVELRILLVMSNNWFRD